MVLSDDSEWRLGIPDKPVSHTRDHLDLAGPQILSGKRLGCSLTLYPLPLHPGEAGALCPPVPTLRINRQLAGEAAQQVQIVLL